MKKINKRFFALLIALALSISVIIPLGAVAEQGSVTVSAEISKTTVVPGEEFTIDIYLSDLSDEVMGMSAVNLYMQLNPVAGVDIFEYVSATPVEGHNPADWNLAYNNQVGNYHYKQVIMIFSDTNMVGYGTPVVGDCKYMSVVLRARADASWGTKQIEILGEAFADYDFNEYIPNITTPVINITIDSDIPPEPTPAPTQEPVLTNKPPSGYTPYPWVGSTPTPAPEPGPDNTPATYSYYIPPSGTSQEDISSSEGGTLKSTPTPVPKFTIVDENTDIKVDSPIDSLPEDTVLDIQPVDISTISGLLKLALEKYGRIVAIYDINLLQNDIAIQPAGNITVSIPVPAGDGNKDYKILRINDDETLEAIKTTVTDGFVRFESDHFSKFALISVPKSNIVMYVVIFVSLIIIAVLLIIYLRARKKGNKLTFK